VGGTSFDAGIDASNAGGAATGGGNAAGGAPGASDGGLDGERGDSGDRDAAAPAQIVCEGLSYLLGARGIAADDARVYVLLGGLNGAGPAQIESCPVDGGSPAIVATGLDPWDATVKQNDNLLVLNAGYLYWIDRSFGGSILRIAAQGGAVEIVARDQSVNIGPFAFDDSRIFWLANGWDEIRWTAKSGGTPAMLVGHVAAGDYRYGRPGLFCDGASLYWRHMDTTLPDCDIAGGCWTIERATTTGRDRALLPVVLHHDASYLQADRDAFYFVDALGGAQSGALTRTARDGSGNTWFSDGVYSFVLDDPFVYYSAGGLKKIHKTGKGGPVPVASASPLVFALNSTHIYWHAVPSILAVPK
jgi:hypothetical protein